MNISRHLSSSAFCKRVGGSTRPSICWRGNSNVASEEPSDLPKKRKTRITLEKRKAMVESYVNKYRAMNSGKFPTLKEARNEVGGSFYIIKNLIQELQHQAKISNTSTVETTYGNIHQDGETRDGNVTSKEAGTLSSVQLPSIVTVQEKSPIRGDNQVSPDTESAKNDESEHEVEEIRQFQPVLDVKVAGNSCETAASNVVSDIHKATKNDESLNDIEEIRFCQSESDVKIAENSRKSAASNVGSDLPKATNAQFIETTLSEQIETPTGDTSQLENVINDKVKVEAADYQKYFHKAENNMKMQDPPKLDKLEPETDQLQAQKLGNVTRESSKHHADDTAVEKKSNLWDNMKSFAGGIFSLFKKQ